MSALRLAVVTETYLPDVNGVAHSLHQLLSALDSDRVEVRLYRPKPRQSWVPSLPEHWCRGIRIPMYPDLQLGVPRCGWLKQCWQKWRPDVVYIATEGPLGYSALRLAKRLSLPVISAFHTNFHRYSDFYGLSWIHPLTLTWLRRFHNQTLATLVPSHDTAHSLHRAGIHGLQVLPHGVDCQRFHPAHRCGSLRQQLDGEVMLYVGRIAAEKNIPVALNAFRALQQRRPQLRLVMVGDGPLREQLQQCNPDVLFTGVLKGEELARYYASADVFVFPSQTETFGLVTLEAMASGLPVVAYASAAAQQFVVSGESGELSADASADGFGAACERMLNQDLSKAGQAARAMAEQLSWVHIAQQFEALLEQVIQHPNGTPARSVHSMV
ncbi:hypothetical protein CHH28_19610 [Bacterioplanes sanyensis]|uniref:Glycosyltransferase subfamily 4-like N-terminal domain-containing protein n=1 Tax=Bacterioplanes sanyensis TaxID=1249553 RepID=A0A222FQR3_9GAMM|nr:glycosyltransferase family 1 protein [Bacterioplanes sanyensis]ASP40741.1 hypothetical protein CHH28_19610 [Bacterioplanes sanyensis]